MTRPFKLQQYHMWETTNAGSLYQAQINVLRSHSSSEDEQVQIRWRKLAESELIMTRFRSPPYCTRVDGGEYWHETLGHEEKCIANAFYFSSEMVRL